MHRGALAIACNLGTDAVDVPVTGEVVLAWGEPTVGAKSTPHRRLFVRRLSSQLSTAQQPVDNCITA